MDDGILIRLYGEQPRSAEKLADTSELARLASVYRIMTKQYAVTDVAILARLLDLRKAGRLPRKTDRATHVQKLDTWGALKSDHYEITIVHDIGFWDIVDAVRRSGGTLPVSRAETLEIVKTYCKQIFKDVEMDREAVEERIKHLFPELWV